MSGSISTKRIQKPTAEQRRQANYELSDVLDRSESGRMLVLGKAYIRKPWFETMFARGMVSQLEVKCLRFYRRSHEAAARSEVRSCLMRDPGMGSGDGPSLSIIQAKEHLGMCEMAIGSVLDTMRAIVIGDMAFKAAAMARFGTREISEIKNGQVIKVIAPISKRHPKIIEDEFLLGLARLVDVASLYVRLER